MKRTCTCASYAIHTLQRVHRDRSARAREFLRRPVGGKHEAPVRIRTGASCLSWWQTSDRVDLVSLRAFWPLGGLELHTLALIERPESGRLDRTVVDENVRAAAVHGDEAVALFGIEPLNGSLRHETSPSVCIRNRTSRSRLLSDARTFL